MQEITKAWAIKMQIPGHPGPNFMGIFYCTMKNPEPYYDGMRTALFRTRKQAREKLATHVLFGAKSKVVRVKITIEEVMP